MKLRPRAVMKWAGAWLCALIFAAWFATRWITPVFIHRSDHYALFEVHRGRVGVLWLPGSLDHSPDPGWHVYEEGRTTGWDWELVCTTESGSYLALIPLYVPLALVSVPTAWLFYRDRPSVRWARKGRCVGCGYDLTGVTGKCPECGRAIDTRSGNRIKAGA